MMDDDLEVEALLRSDNEEDVEIKQVNLKFKANNDNFRFLSLWNTHLLWYGNVNISNSKLIDKQNLNISSQILCVINETAWFQFAMESF